MNKLSVLGIIVGAALLSATPFSLQWSQKNVALSLDSADARVGRPLTRRSPCGGLGRAQRGHAMKPRLDRAPPARDPSRLSAHRATAAGARGKAWAPAPMIGGP